MTHGRIANVVSEITSALDFESGESWSEPSNRGAPSIGPSLALFCSKPLLNSVVNLYPLTPREWHEATLVSIWVEFAIHLGSS